MLSAMAGTAWGQKTAQETSEKNEMDGRCTYADFSQPSQVNCDDDDDDIPAPIDKSRPLGRGSRVSTAAKNFGKTGPAWAQATFGDAYGKDAGNVRVLGTVLQVHKGLGAQRFRVHWDIRASEPEETAAGECVDSNPAAVGRIWWTSALARKEEKDAGVPLLPLNGAVDRPTMSGGQTQEVSSEKGVSEVSGECA